MGNNRHGEARAENCALVSGHLGVPARPPGATARTGGANVPAHGAPHQGSKKRGGKACRAHGLPMLSDRTQDAAQLATAGRPDNAPHLARQQRHGGRRHHRHAARIGGGPLVPRESGCKPDTRRLQPGNRLPLRTRAAARQLAPQCVPARNAGCTAGASWRGKPPHSLAKSTFAPPRWLAASNSSCACAHAVRLDTTRTPARRNAAAIRWLDEMAPERPRRGQALKPAAAAASSALAPLSMSNTACLTLAANAARRPRPLASLDRMDSTATSRRCARCSADNSGISRAAVAQISQSLAMPACAGVSPNASRATESPTARQATRAAMLASCRTL